MTDTNVPKILVEFSPEEITWLADRLHEEWSRIVKAGALASSPEAIAKVEAHKKMESELRNRLLNKAHDQGFGEL